jgi:hypothetical protein
LDLCDCSLQRRPILFDISATASTTTATPRLCLQYDMDNNGILKREG